MAMAKWLTSALETAYTNSRDSSKAQVIVEERRHGGVVNNGQSPLHKRML